MCLGFFNVLHTVVKREKNEKKGELNSLLGDSFPDPILSFK